MTKRQRELQLKMLEKTNAAKALMEGENKDLVKAEALLNEVDELQKEFDLEARLEATSKAQAVEKAEPVKTEPEKVDAVKALADAARARFKNMNEGTGADGGYTVPEDIQTKVNEYKQERFSLASLIDYETVTTKSGKRTYKSRAQHTGFTEVAEGGKIGKTATPKFEIISYLIKKYAGYLPVTNELLDDSDAAIADTIIAWLGEESIATENAQILAKVKAKGATPITGIKDIKKAVNVTLAAFTGSVRIITNADGLQYLDTLEDKNGRPLLSPDPTQPMAMSLTVGARSIPLVVVPNDVLATTENKIPFIVGDLKEYMKEFDRKQLSIALSDVAVMGDFNAWEQDMTLFRGIMRADFVVKDTMAIVFGELTVTA
jgi:HK97 family phage major capsid protein